MYYSYYTTYVYYWHYSLYCYYNIYFIAFIFNSMPFLSQSLNAILCRKRSFQTSAQDDDTHSDSESTGALHSPETDAGRTAWCQSRSVSSLCSVSLYHVPVLIPFTFLWFQVQRQRNCRQTDFHFEQEYCSSDRRHVLVDGIQNGVSGRKGNTHLTLYYHYNTL